MSEKFEETMVLGGTEGHPFSYETRRYSCELKTQNHRGLKIKPTKVLRVSIEACCGTKVSVEFMADDIEMLYVKANEWGII